MSTNNKINKISIKINKKPDLKIVKMNCDSKLYKSNYDMMENLNSHSTTIFIGKPGSGKTSLVLSFFDKCGPLNKVFHNIFIFQPSESAASMGKNIFNKIPEDQIFRELDYENLNSVITTLKSEDPNSKNCIIFDDMTAYLKNSDSKVKKLLKELIFNRRHLHCSVYFLVQTWFSIEKDIRKLFTNIFLFKSSRAEQENIFDEMLELDKSIIPKLNKLVYTQPYSYLMININSNRLFTNFNEILLE